MAADIPTIEPTRFRSGETVKWTKALADYSYADGWRLTYYLRGGQGALDIAASADSDGIGFSATISAAHTGQLPAGLYWMEGRVAYNGEAYVVVPSYQVTVDPDFSNTAQVQAGYDGRSHARKMLDALQSAQLSAGGQRIVSYTIFGQRTVTNYSQEQWQKEYAFWESKVRDEEKQAKADRGERTGIYMRFRNPR